MTRPIGQHVASALPARDAETVKTPAARALDSWIAHRWENGVQLDQLAQLTVLSVQTKNSTYEIIITEPNTRAVLVRGGRYFPEFTRARVAGSSLGGSFLKVGGIYVGFRLELQLGPRVIITSPVDFVGFAATESSPQ